MMEENEMFTIKDVFYKEETWCEHCGNLEPYTAVVDFDSVWYCLDCAKYDGNFKVTNEEIREIEIIEVDKMIQYFDKRLVSLRNYRETLDCNE